MIIKFILFVLALYLTEYILPILKIGVTISEGYRGLIITAVIFYICNYIVIPILRVLTFPITIITFGLSSTLIGMLVFYFSLKINPYLSYTSVWSLLGFIIILNIIWWIINKLG